MKKNFLLSTILLAFTLFTVTPAFAQQTQQPEIKPTITNITPYSFTVSWFTEQKESSTISFGKTEPLSATATDDRGASVYETHHVTLKSLEPNTEYKFKIGTSGKIQSQKTSALLPRVIPPLPERFKGTVQTEDKTPPKEAITYLIMEGAQMLSVPVNADGTWEVRTVNTRKADLSAFFVLEGTNYVDFFARAGIEGQGFNKIFAYGRDNSVTINLNESKIPFFKVQLTNQAQFPVYTGSASPQATPTPNSESGAQPASQNFFQTIWARLKDLF